MTITRIDLFAQILALVILVAIIKLHLLPALLAGLLIYILVELGARLLSHIGVIPFSGKIILLTILSLLTVTAVVLTIMQFLSYISNGPESFVALLQKMADIASTTRSYLPVWAQHYLPSNFEEWQSTASEWLRENALHFSFVGKEAGLFLLHIIIGMVIGGMIALNSGFKNPNRPLSGAIAKRVELLSSAFRRIIFSQVRISALNTFLTAIFLIIILPLTGNHLPMTKAMIAVTFLAGLLPIVGNLISNTVIVLISLSVSPLTAAFSLIFLIVIHKLEYFVNAHIIGTQIRARAWEILIAMIVMESAFGLAGLVAAPIYYAYLKDELSSQKLI